MDISIGATYDVKAANGGAFTATAHQIEHDTAVVVLIPTHPEVRRVYPRGYHLGRAHWESCLTKLSDPVTD